MDATSPGDDAVEQRETTSTGLLDLEYWPQIDLGAELFNIDWLDGVPLRQDGPTGSLIEAGLEEPLPVASVDHNQISERDDRNLDNNIPGNAPEQDVRTLFKSDFTCPCFSLSVGVLAGARNAYFQ